MRKATMHYILDACEGSILVAMVVSGLILWFALPEGSAPGKTFLFDRQTWVQTHQCLALGLIGFFSTHILTHQTWIIYMTKSFFRRKS